MSLSPFPRRPHTASRGEFIAFIIAYLHLLVARLVCTDRGPAPMWLLEVEVKQLG
jgi:hypothetical protein